MPRKGKAIAGMIRVSNFPLAPVLAIKLSYYVDHLVCAFDYTSGYSNYSNGLSGAEWHEFFKIVQPFNPECNVDMFPAKHIIGTGGGSYLEEMLRRLDEVKPYMVIEPEGDGMFDYDGGFIDELDEFIEGNYDIWMMMCTSVVCDNRKVPDYPFSEHCRAFKWYEGITYLYANAPGFAIPKFPIEGYPLQYRSKTKLQHFPLFTRKLEFERWYHYGIEKAVHAYNLMEA